MQLRTKRRWPFSKRETNTSSKMLSQPSAAVSQSYSLYRSITELPLSRWIDMTVDGYLKAIVKEGAPPVDILHQTENELRIQYADAIGDGEYKLYVTAVKEVAVLELTLAQIHHLVGALREVYVPQLANALNKLLLSSLVFDVANPAEYDNTLLRALRRSGGTKIRLELKKLHLAELEKKYTGTTKNATREYYMGVLISLSDSAGFQLSDNITVWEFCERIKRHNKKSESINNKKHG